MNSIKNIDLKNQRVLLRADLNIPISDKNITNDHKLNALLPSIRYIQENGGKIILATHIGRPDAQSQTNYFDEQRSTKIISGWLTKNNFSVDYEIDLLQAKKKSYENYQSILLLENLRFFNGEKEGSVEFAKLLSELADIYINDAFGLIHRDDTSITLLPQQFLPKNKGVGLLVEKEMHELDTIKTNPKQPFILVLGGSKIESKISLLEGFITNKLPASILIGGALSFPFLQALENTHSFFSFDEKTVYIAQKILDLAQQNNIKVVLPVDLAVANPDTNSVNIHTTQQLPSTGNAYDIGPKTIALFQEKITEAQTIFANGTMGKYEDPLYATGSKEVLQAIADSNAHSIIGGGDGVAAAQKFGVEKNISFLSSGGGASLAYLSTSNPVETFAAFRSLE